MKKVIAVILMVVMLFVLVGCNYNIVDTKWAYNKAYVNFGDHVECFKITSWAEDETTFTLTCEDGTIICSSQYNIVLVKEKEDD